MTRRAAVLLAIVALGVGYVLRGSVPEPDEPLPEAEEEGLVPMAATTWSHQWPSTIPVPPITRWTKTWEN